MTIKELCSLSCKEEACFMSFTNLNYLDSIVVKLRIKSIFSFVGMFLFIIFLGFINRLIPIQEGASLYVANISAVLLVLMCFLSYYAFENLQFYNALRDAQKIYKRTIGDPDGPTEDDVNEYMQLGLDRFGETLEFKKSYEIITLEKIQGIDKKRKEFEFNVDKKYHSTIRGNLDWAMDLLCAGFNMKCVFTKPKFSFYRKWKRAHEDSIYYSES